MRQNLDTVLHFGDGKDATMSPQETTPIVAPVGGHGTISPVKTLTPYRYAATPAPVSPGNSTQNLKKEAESSSQAASFNKFLETKPKEDSVEAEAEAIREKIAKEEVAETLIVFGRRLEFSRDENGKALVLVINQETNEILKRVPPGTISELLKDMGENLLGRFLKTQV